MTGEVLADSATEAEGAAFVAKQVCVWFFVVGWDAVCLHALVLWLN